MRAFVAVWVVVVVVGLGIIVGNHFALAVERGERSFKESQQRTKVGMQGGITEADLWEETEAEALRPPHWWERTILWRVICSTCSFIGTLLIGVVFFQVNEGWSSVDALY